MNFETDDVSVEADDLGFCLMSHCLNLVLDFRIEVFVVFLDDKTNISPRLLPQMLSK